MWVHGGPVHAKIIPSKVTSTLGHRCVYIDDVNVHFDVDIHVGVNVEVDIRVDIDYIIDVVIVVNLNVDGCYRIR